MGVLDTITGPQDLRGLSDDELETLASEIRDRLITSCAPVGGHLGPNLGVVELTMAIHRIFDSPRDRIVWDTGHQAYVHKMLTGRAGEFGGLRTEGGLSGYPSRAESPHDLVENSHASTALSYADGLAKAYAIRGEDRHVVAVIGDGALTGGMAWEALNNISIAKTSRLVIVVNDNGRSYTPTVGGLATALTSLRTNPRYEQVLDVVKRRLNAVPGVGPTAYDALHAMKKGVKDAVAPQGLFEDLGLKYVGPVDGHDRAAVEHALLQARKFNGPVIVHALTRKGFGYDAAERHEADQFHQVGPFDPDSGEQDPKGNIWTNAFSDEIVRIGQRRQDVVAVTAAMMHPVGLHNFQARFPERTFDVGIAEQHAATSAAGLAMGGMHPVVAIYATFLNRAFDQVLMDCALHGCGVTFVLDRAGVTGDDGASHNGMWDMSVLQVVPGLRLAAPRDATRLRELLNEAVDVDDAPTVVRFPKGPPPDDIPAVDKAGGVDVLVRNGAKDVLVVAVGAMATTAVDVADRLRDQGIGVTVVDPRWVKPVDPAILDLARQHRLVVSIEDNGETGGCGAVLLQTLNAAGVTTPFRLHAIPQQFLDARQAGPHPRAGRSHPPGDRPRNRRGHHRALRRPGSHHTGRRRPPCVATPPVPLLGGSGPGTDGAWIDAVTPVLGDRRYVTDGGLETDLIFHHGVDLPEFASFPLVQQTYGRELLAHYYDGYADVAGRAGAGLLLEAPDVAGQPRLGCAARLRRRGARPGQPGLDRLPPRAPRRPSGAARPGRAGRRHDGPRGDGYVPGDRLSPEEYADYHRPQLASFQGAGADVATALTLVGADEAIGIVTAARDVGLPIAVSFTVETDGRLAGGTSLREAVEEVDAAGGPDWFLVNCAHPTHVAPAIDDGAWTVASPGSAPMPHGCRTPSSTRPRSSTRATRPSSRRHCAPWCRGCPG